MEALLNDISPKSDHAISWLKALLSIYLFIHHPYNETGYPAEEKKKCSFSFSHRNGETKVVHIHSSGHTAIHSGF